ncbi:presenilins-associated rhomboid-like protein, mitochondrial isoform X1 [Marmota marmota marmota]|uniref:presenilins-associated rhomboid-like protein, mitochondrial isoform X1 n=1 Tax=Marmota marmota marmota TaxID=9994 RepID=UPI0020933261|nr:presenilins-associated rhomboid-like protein, mitochondrial isoform X1 [Marmota marmota marmota]
MAWRGWAHRGWGCGQAWAPPRGGRSCNELITALAPPRLLGRRFNFFIQQKCGFRKAPRKVEPRRSDTGSSGEAYKRSALIPPVEETVFYPSPYPIRTLIKPFFFTVGFTGCAFGSAAIWQYESLKSRVQSYFNGIKADWLDSIRPQKEGDLRKEINKWWNNLSDGQRTVTGQRVESGPCLSSGRCLPVMGWPTLGPSFRAEPRGHVTSLSQKVNVIWWFLPADSDDRMVGIIAANVLVFCLWRVPSLQRTMMRYFTSNPASKVLCSPMLLSTFSHFSLFHMAANMYVLWSFSSSIVNILGQEQFMAVYLSAGVISNFVSYMCKVATGRYGPSLGASGAIMSVLAAVCTKIPEGRLAIIFLPMFTFTAGNALKAIIAMDTAGMILGWKFFDHAAHLGGAVFGIWYITYGHELIWKNREPLVKMWHEMRTDGPKKGGGSK